MNKIFTFENFQVFYSAHRNNFSLFGCANIVARGGNLGIVCFLLSSPPPPISCSCPNVRATKKRKYFLCTKKQLWKRFLHRRYKRLILHTRDTLQGDKCHHKPWSICLQSVSVSTSFGIFSVIDGPRAMILLNSQQQIKFYGLQLVSSTVLTTISIYP